MTDHFHNHSDAGRVRCAMRIDQLAESDPPRRLEGTAVALLPHWGKCSGVYLSLNMGVRISQVKPSNCFRRLEKSVLPSIFDTSLLSVMMRNLQSYPTTVLNERRV